MNYIYLLAGKTGTSVKKTFKKDISSFLTALNYMRVGERLVFEDYVLKKQDDEGSFKLELLLTEKIENAGNPKTN